MGAEVTFDKAEIALAVFPACVAAARPATCDSDEPGWREREAASAAFRFAAAFIAARERALIGEEP